MSETSSSRTNRWSISRIPSAWVFLGLVILALLVRLPFFFIDVIDWDESTYILNGQALLDQSNNGLDSWGFRSYPYALVIAVLGSSLVAVRLAGAFCVGAVAFGVFLSGEKLWSRTAGLMASVLWIFLVGLIPSGQATMAEFFALVPLMLAFVLLLREHHTHTNLFLLGTLLGLASLVRLNLAYVAVFLGGFILLFWIKDGVKKSFARLLFYGVGGLVVLGLSTLPYFFTGREFAEWTRNFDSGLSYANSQLSVVQAATQHMRYGWNTLTQLEDLTFVISGLVWFGGAIGLFVALSSWKRASPLQRKRLSLLVLFLASTGFSILVGGASYAHYLIQLVPFMALGASHFLLFLHKRGFRSISIALVLLSIGMAVTRDARAYQQTALGLAGKTELFRGPAFEIAEFLERDDQVRRPVYMMDLQIVYWFLDIDPISRSVIHPSNLTKPFLLDHYVAPGTTPEMEIRSILEKEPRYIVKPEEVYYLAEDPEVRAILEESLDSEYVLVEEIDGRKIGGWEHGPWEIYRRR